MQQLLISRCINNDINFCYKILIFKYFIHVFHTFALHAIKTFKNHLTVFYKVQVYEITAHIAISELRRFDSLNEFNHDLFQQLSQVQGTANFQGYKFRVGCTL